MSHPNNPSAGDGGGGSGCPPPATAAPTIENYMRGSDWRGKWRKAATTVHIEPRKPLAFHSQHGGVAAERPNSGGPVIIDWRKTAAPGTTPPKRPRPWSGEPQWHSNHAKGHHGKGHHHQGPWEGDWQQQQQQDSGWNQGGEPWQGDRNWEGGRWWNWEANPAAPSGTWDEDSGSREQQWSANDGWNQQYHRGGQGGWGGEETWEEGKWQAADQQRQQPAEQQDGAPPLGGDVKTQHDPSQEQSSKEPSTKKARSASKSPDGQPGSAIFVNALRKLFQAKNAAAAKAPAKTATTTTDNNNPALWEEGKAPEKPLGGGALTALLSKQATMSAVKAPSPVPSPGSPSNGQSDTELRKNVLTRLLASENAGELLQDPKVVEMLLQVASQLDESGLSDLQKSVVKIITKLQSASSPTAAAASTLPPDQLAKRGACVERLKAILEGLRGLFLERQEKRISQASRTAAATAKLSSSTPSHSHLASLLSGVSAQNQPIYDHKVWTGHVQRSGVNKAKVNLYATLPVNSLTTALVAQLGNELNLKLRVPDTEVLHQRQNHADSSALLLMKADSAADQAELNAQIAYFNGRSRSGVAKFERDGEHYAVFMIPPGELAEKLIGSDNYKRCNPDDMATVCMITKSDTSTATH